MLKGVPAIIPPELLKVLSEMGHGDEIVISDAHFPACSVNSRVIHVGIVPSPEMLKAFIKLIELDQYVEKPVVMMAPVPGDEVDPELLAECREVLGADAERIDFIERFAFYDRAKTAYAVVVTGEQRKYGNILVKKGVTMPE